jgi:hypothetical protein
MSAIPERRDGDPRDPADCGRAVVAKVLGGPWPDAQRGHVERWQVYLAHSLRDLR